MEAKGDIYYGLHFYPGVCQYQEGDGEPYRVFLPEDTLRSMDPSFAGCPVFLLHVDEVEQDINKLRTEADGWVIRSFFNEADGKHWAEFVVVSSRAKDAIARGLKLSNCYLPSSLGPGGTWNGIDYKNQILEARYEHLAIVPNPRYEESIILNPDQFKKYNADKLEELKKLANSKQERKSMFNFFKKTKVENSADYDSMSVQLPKSKIEISIAKLINDADEHEMKKDEARMCDGSDMVEHKGEKMTLDAFKAKHDAMCDEMEKMKKDDDGEDMGEDEEEMMDSEDEPKKNKFRKSKRPKNKDEDGEYKGYMDADDDMEYAESEPDMSPDDEEDMAKEEKLRKEEMREVKDSKHQNAIEKAKAKAKADKLRNADKDFRKYDQDFGQREVELGSHQVRRGQELFGSSK